MPKDFSDILSKYYQNIKGYAYKKIEIDSKNFYFIYKLKVVKIKDEISNIELDPLGIIVEEKEEYYIYSLNESLNSYLEKNYKNIVKDFINSVYLGNGIFSDSTIISIK